MISAAKESDTTTLTYIVLHGTFAKSSVEIVRVLTSLSPSEFSQRVGGKIVSAASGEFLRKRLS